MIINKGGNPRYQTKVVADMLQKRLPPPATRMLLTARPSPTQTPSISSSTMTPVNANLFQIYTSVVRLAFYPSPYLIVGNAPLGF